MRNTKLRCVVALAMVLVPLPRLAAQVQTDVPPPVPGAKPVTVEHIKVHGAALEGNLEGNAVDRDVFVFLPPGYGTLVINMSGCFLIGLILTLLARTTVSPYWRYLIPIGFIGAYTTFSTFEYETLRAVQDG